MCQSKDKHQKDTCLKENELRAQNMLTILGSTITWLGETCMTTKQARETSLRLWIRCYNSQIDRHLAWNCMFHILREVGAERKVSVQTTHTPRLPPFLSFPLPPRRRYWYCPSATDSCPVYGVGGGVYFILFGGERGKQSSVPSVLVEVAIHSQPPTPLNPRQGERTIHNPISHGFSHPPLVGPAPRNKYLELPTSLNFVLAPKEN